MDIFKIDLMSISWASIIVSLLGSAVISATVTGMFNLRSKQKEYINDYYKIVLQKRIIAYEQLENFVLHLKLTVYDIGDQPYHLCLKDKNSVEEIYENLLLVLTQSLWISNKAFTKTREFNSIFYKVLTEFDNENIDTATLGKKYYENVANLRTDIEIIIAKDMLELYDVKKFLKEKKSQISEFSPFPS